MKKLREFVHYFITITTGILTICAISYSSQAQTPTAATLWHILLSAGLGALSTVVFFPDEDASKLRINIGLILHFISLCIIMIFCGRRFGWIESGFLPALAMVGYVVIVYAFTASVTYLISRREAKLLNQQLKKKFAKDADEKTM